MRKSPQVLSSVPVGSAQPPPASNPPVLSSAPVNKQFVTSTRKQPTCAEGGSNRNASNGSGAEPGALGFRRGGRRRRRINDYWLRGRRRRRINDHWLRGRRRRRIQGKGRGLHKGGEGRSTRVGRGGWGEGLRVRCGIQVLARSIGSAGTAAARSNTPARPQCCGLAVCTHTTNTLEHWSERN